jgi:ribosomal protein S3AE
MAKPEKKKFFDVEISALRTSIKLMAYTIEELDNRNVKLDLTRMLRGQSIEALIKVKVGDGKASGKIIRLSVLGFFIRRMMRKSISYVEDSFSVESSDAILKIKPFLITRKKVTRAVRNALRVGSKSFIEEYTKNKSCEEIVSDIISGKMQKSLSYKLKKVYPLALCEIRDMKIEKEKEMAKIEKMVENPVEVPEEKK